MVDKSQLCQKKQHYVNGLEASEQIDQAGLAKLVGDQDAEPGIELVVDRSQRVKWLERKWFTSISSAQQEVLPAQSVAEGGPYV